MDKYREETQWQEAVCLNGQMEIQLPREFEIPSDDVAGRKFPYEQKPQEIYMDSTGERIITFNLLKNALEEKQVYSAVKEMQQTIGHLYPESIRQRARCLRTGEETVGWFSFVTGGMAGDCTHNLFVLPQDGRMLLGSYHFPERDEAEETEVFLKMIRSIVLKKKTQEKAGGWYVGGNIWG